MNKYIISSEDTIMSAFKMLDALPILQTVFVSDTHKRIIGTVTDGDIRRGFINGLNLDDLVKDFVNKQFSFLVEGEENFKKFSEFRVRMLKAVPLLNKDGDLLKIYDFTKTKSILPIDAVIMAGGKGERLYPLTKDIPKPLLQIGDKTIISYNFDRLLQFGINNQHVTVNYLSDQIKDYCSGYNSDINFNIVQEDCFLGTAGALSLINKFDNELVLLMNSDLLTDIDYEDLYKHFISSNADILVASVPYPVSIPYAIFKNEGSKVKSFEEKPEYIYYANAGIYLIKKDLINLIPKGKMYNATDFMQIIIDSGKNLQHYPIQSYWLDIGKHNDYIKAQQDISRLKWS
tara:strand:+ start:961 stop:1998 length:1038 start_codon:yes stop_codon:yes gene_type:complete